MSVFSDMLKSDETIFSNQNALTFDYIPKVIRFREAEQRQIINSIKPLLHERDGKNIFFFGRPGIGKTLAVKKVLESIDDPTDDQYGDVGDLVYPIYINCWNKNTSFKIVEEICSQVGYKFTQNKKTEELFKIVSKIINRKSAVFAFDEIDKVQDFDFMYTLLEQIYRKSIIIITNHKEFILQLEERVRSRLSPEIVEFKPYNEAEIRDILLERQKSGFRPGVWDDEAFAVIVRKAYDAKDIRAGLHLMKEAGENAELESCRKITVEHAKKAAGKIDEMSIKNSEELEDESRFILNLVKKNSGEKIGEIFKKYQQEGGSASYKTFQRKIQRLADNKFATVKKITGGAEGTTTIVNYLRTKKLTEF